jgi:hypothetical protein
MKYHFTPTRMAQIKQTASHTCWQGCGHVGSPTGGEKMV